MNAGRSRLVWVWLANLLVPGAGLVSLGRIAAGAALAAAWAVAAAAAIVLSIFEGASHAAAGQRALAWAAMAGLYVGAQVWLALALRALRRDADRDRDGGLRRVIVPYLQGRLEDAEAACWGLLQADPDDLEVTLYLGSIARRRGDRAGAVRFFKRVRYLDGAGKWDFEVGRELAALGEGGAREAPLPDLR
jgi:tetratricopeptide (TPR) repeat protein